MTRNAPSMGERGISVSYGNRSSLKAKNYISSIRLPNALKALWKNFMFDDDLILFIFRPAHANTTFWNRDGSWSAGPNLPGRLMGHCLVQYDETTTYLIGGCTNFTTAVYKFLYVFDWKTSNWTRLTNMAVPRCGEPCCFHKMRKQH